MEKKTVWIVNQYNGINVLNSRQSHLAKMLDLNGYNTYVIGGHSFEGLDQSYKQINPSCIYRETDETKGYLIKTPEYKNNIQRFLASIKFQLGVWKNRKALPQPDVIVSDFAGIFGNVFLKWKKRYGTRIIFDVLDLWPEGFIEMGYLKKDSVAARYLYSQEHKSYREADRIIFSMQGGKDYIVDKGWSQETGGDVDTDHIGYLNNGIDLERVDMQKEKYILDDPDLDTEKFKVLYLGSISHMNGLEILVETARILQERREDNIQILLYGYGNQEESLKKLAEKYQLNNLKFKGRLDNRYGINCLSRGDLMVFTFRDLSLWKYGVSPNKLFMYFASGKPVLSMIKPAYDLVEGKKAGISVEYNPEKVADAIICFSQMNKEEYKEYCKNARKTAEEYDYKNLVNVLIDQIEG